MREIAREREEKREARASTYNMLLGEQRADPRESSLYLDDKEPGRTESNLTQWNGRMVMETAFNLHRRSLFVDVRGKGEGREREGERESEYLLPCSGEKSIVPYLSIRSYILFRLRVARERRISL